VGLDGADVHRVRLVAPPVHHRLPGLDEEPLLRGHAVGAAQGRVDLGALLGLGQAGELPEVGDPVVGEGEVRVHGDGPAIRLDGGLVADGLLELLAAEVVLVRLEVAGREVRHPDARGLHLGRRLAQPGARPLREAIDHRRHAGLPAPLLLQREEVLAPLGVEHLELDRVEVVEAPDRGEDEGAYAGAEREFAA
jgi:hypothetical protein